MKGQSFYLLVLLIALVNTTSSKIVVQKQGPVSVQCFTKCLCERSLSWHISIRCREKGILSIPRNMSSYTTEIDFARNRISFLRQDAFASTRLLENIQLQDNAITELPGTAFKYLLALQHLSLARNKIKYLPERLFIGLYHLNFLDLGRNELSVLPNKTFTHLRNLQTLGLQGNKIKDLPQIVFRGLYNLQILFLNDNLLTEIPRKVFDELTNLETLFLSRNKLTSVRNENFIALQKLYLLLLNGNKIDFIHNRAFANLSSLYYLFLNDNEMESILDTFFLDADSIRVMTLSNNPVTNMTLQAFGTTKLDKLFMLNIHLKHFRVTGTVTSARETKLYVSYHCTPPEIVLRNTSQHYRFLTDAFAFGGFHCNHSLGVCKPCSYGTYMVTSRDGHKCVPCPPGGFYQNSVGHHGNVSFGIGCKSCSRGTYVKPYKNPGKDPSHCKVCPSGTKSNESAGYRACKCFDGFHRFYRFGDCGKCPLFGVDCSGEYMALLPGYYWIWDDLKKKTEYEDFSRNLDIDDDSYDRRTVWYNGSIPKLYPCLHKSPCRGGVSASCATGHYGVLCENCKKGYYKTMFNCKECPSDTMIAVKIFIVFAAILVASVVLKIRAQRRREPGARSPVDAFVSKLKIIVSFYHLTPCMLESFPYIEWPYPMSITGEYAKLIQLDVLQFIPPQCIIPNLRFTAFHKMIIFVTVNLLVILLGWIVYKLRIRCIPTRAHPDKKRAKKELIQENICRYVYLFLFFTFPSTCLSVVRLFPANCHYLCADNENTRCAWYLKADYRVICFEKEYNRYIGLAYFCMLYPITIGTLGVLILWRTYKRNRLYILAIKKIKKGYDDEDDEDVDDSDDDGHDDDLDDDDQNDLKKIQLNLAITDRRGSGNSQHQNIEEINVQKIVLDEGDLEEDPVKKLQEEYDKLKFTDKTPHSVDELTNEARTDTIFPGIQVVGIPKVRIIVEKPKDDHEEEVSESSPENKTEKKDKKNGSFLKTDGFYEVVEKGTKSSSEDEGDFDQITKLLLGDERKEKWRDVRDKKAFVTELQKALLSNHGYHSNQVIRNTDAIKEKEIVQNEGEIPKMELLAEEYESKFLKSLSALKVSSPEEIGLTFVHGDGLAKGAKFLYENYEQELWYWEIIETFWKLLITSGIVLTGKVTRSTIGISSVISGMYVVVCAFRRPISDPFDNFLHLSSLVVTFINMTLGVYLKINLENADSSYDLFINSTPVVVIVACSNGVLFILLVFHYFYVCLYLRFKAWFMKTRLYKFIDDRFISPVNAAINRVKEKIRRIKRRVDKAIQSLVDRDDYVGVTCRLLKKYLDKVKERI